MTTIQSFQSPLIGVNTDVLRKAAATFLAITAAAVLVLFVVASKPSFAWLPAWSPSTTYFVALVACIGGISALGIRENANDARKMQFDIR